MFHDNRAELAYISPPSSPLFLVGRACITSLRQLSGQSRVTHNPPPSPPAEPVRCRLALFPRLRKIYARTDNENCKVSERVAAMARATRTELFVFARARQPTEFVDHPAHPELGLQILQEQLRPTPLFGQATIIAFESKRSSTPPRFCKVM
jgi:hypothetical protein